MAIEKIAYHLGQRDEQPNKDLAAELAASEDKVGIAEIARFLSDKNPSIASDCIAVLYHVGYIKPELITIFVNDFFDLLESKHNRMVWGAMIALSTIASTATMIGLLGTTIGMIRAFNATGHAAGGVIDATALATGISEALVNTAGGLFNAIVGIIAYNYFVNKVDSFNYTIDEASYEVVQLFKSREAGA